MVKTSVDPVDAEVGEQEEEGILEEIVPRKWSVGRKIIQFRITADLGQEKGCREYGHEGHCHHGLPYLEPDLIFEIFGMVEGPFVEDK